ncbi:MAG: UDP-N-acetylmuramoyl-L-alanyl-D-glutamate--2,6-diaminopimelate ligase [Oligoflexia bacterium]|nr:UDP-N-acetylmuramoyl-L-alanyl-D-glutamate--2,6-diaminopimelate ligase [Oligoflexia bacterium]
MTLANLINGIGHRLLQGSLNDSYKNLTSDSRSINSGDVFVAVKGARLDGHDFVIQALESGVAAVVVEHPKMISSRFKGAVIQVADTRKIISQLASNHYDRPSEKLYCVGVTGTNGKTTTTHIIESVLNSQGIKTAVIGTINNHLGSKTWPATHTTPDPVHLQWLCSEFVKDGANALSMEVSSHALDQFRVEGVQFDAAVLTNITRDHLDYHKTFEQYIQAKVRLFSQLLKNSKKKNVRAIVNIHDPKAEQFRVPGLPVWTYGFDRSDFCANNVKLDLGGTSFDLLTSEGSLQIRLHMIGRHNVLNALAAVAVGRHKGLGLQQLAHGIQGIQSVRGRLEAVPNSKGLHIFVDYAHTDDALKNVLTFLKDLKSESGSTSRIITVFGCGGDRDRGKRPLMMKVALEHSDKVIVTSDNPRTEEPISIIEDILHNVVKEDLVSGRVLTEPDRKLAIGRAISEAKKGDVVLIAGKGHETYQIVGTTKHPFDDVEVAKGYL